MGAESAFLVPDEPLRMRLERVVPIEVGAQAGDDAQSAFLGRGGAGAKKIPVAEELASPVKGYLGRIKSQDAGHADQHGVHLEARPVISPRLDIELDRIALVEVELSDPPDPLVPAHGRLPAAGPEVAENMLGPEAGQHAGLNRRAGERQEPAPIDLHIPARTLHSRASSLQSVRSGRSPVPADERRAPAPGSRARRPRLDAFGIAGTFRGAVAQPKGAAPNAWRAGRSRRWRWEKDASSLAA